MRIRRYSELKSLSSFEDRYEYLKLFGEVGRETFGFDRYLNQRFYKSPEWRRARDLVIVRDDGCDLGIQGLEIRDRILIHHMNPITIEDIDSLNMDILNPEYLISVSHNTHNAIHYGLEAPMTNFVERRPGDTRLW